MYVNCFICICLEVNIYIQSTRIALPLLTFAHSCVASTSNPSRFLTPFGLLPCFPQLQRPIHHAFLLLLDLCLLSRSFNVQSTTVSCSFWTSACFPTALTSNPPRLLAPFGLPHASPQLQRPIQHAFLLLLDLCLLPRSFNVQSNTLSCSFWTSTMLPHSFNVQSTTIYLLILDFCHASRSFNVQSTTLSCSFWTSVMPPAASTSNPPRFFAHFGLLPASPPPKSPIHHASNPPHIQATLASPQPQATHNAKKQHQHIRASIALYLLILF